MWAHQRCKRRVIRFIDNDSAMFSLIKGYSLHRKLSTPFGATCVTDKERGSRGACDLKHLGRPIALTLTDVRRAVSEWNRLLATLQVSWRGAGSRPDIQAQREHTLQVLEKSDDESCAMSQEAYPLLAWRE